MISVDLSTRECDGHVIVALRGELDITDAVSVATALAVAAARAPEIIVDLAGLEFIDCGGVAALTRGRRQARHAGGDLRLAAAQQQVLRVLTLTRLIETFPVHASADEAAGSAGRSWPAAAPTVRQGQCPSWMALGFLPAACNAAGARSCRRVPSAGCTDDR